MNVARKLSKLALAAALLALNLAPGQPAWAAVVVPGVIEPPMAASYVRDLRRIMEANQTLAQVQNGLAAAEGSLLPAEREILAAFRRDVLPKDLYQRARFTYADKLLAPLAAELAVLMARPAYRKRALQALTTPGKVGYDSPFFTAAEVRELRRIDASKAMADWRVREAGLQKDLLEMVKWWKDEFGMGVVTLMLRNLGKAMEQITAMSDDAEPPATIPLESTGVSAFDEVIKVSAENTLQIRRVSYHFSQRLAPLEIHKLLDAKQLASAEGVAAARQRLDQADVLLEAYLKEIDETVRAREKAAHQLVLVQDPRFLKGVNTGLSQMYAKMMDLSEAQRGVNDQFRVALEFFAAQQGRYKLQDGLLQFDSDAAADKANLLVNNVRKAQAQLLATGAEIIQSEAQTVRSMNNASPPAVK